MTYLIEFIIFSPQILFRDVQCIDLRLLIIFIGFFKIIIFIEFDRFLKTFIDSCIVCKYIHKLLF